MTIEQFFKTRSVMWGVSAIMLFGAATATIGCWIIGDYVLDRAKQRHYMELKHITSAAESRYNTLRDGIGQKIDHLTEVIELMPKTTATYELKRGLLEIKENGV